MLTRYREQGTPSWRRGHPLWFDARQIAGATARSKEYRGSLVGLQPGASYEIEVYLTGPGLTASVTVATWSESFPVAKTVKVKDSASTLVISESGKAGGYVLYTGPAVIDVNNGAEYNVHVKGSHVILRDLTLRGARRHAILLDKQVHDVVIEDSDISGWGRIDKDGWGMNYDSAVSSDGSSPGMKRIIVQRNRMHHPRSDANNWKEQRNTSGGYKGYHPQGPQAVSLWNTGGNHVIRHNEVYFDAKHHFNDGFGAGANLSHAGFPAADSDIYGNRVSHCWDDAIESEGANQNVRIWGNLIDRTFISYGVSATSLGPLFIFRNVSHRHQYSHQHHSSTGRWLKAQSKTVKGTFWGDGRVYLYHNTLFRTGEKEGVGHGISDVGASLRATVSRNNILDASGKAIDDHTKHASNDLDYDLYQGEVLTAASQEKHGLKAAPIYDPTSPSGKYGLKAGSVAERGGPAPVRS